MESFLNIAASVTTILLAVVALAKWLGTRASIYFLMTGLCIALIVFNLVVPPTGNLGTRWEYTLSGVSISFAGIGGVRFMISGIQAVWRNRQVTSSESPKRGPDRWG